MAGKDDWLHKLPLAPTYYPTDTEFADPIAYISKIEKEASGFGICKVVPPLPRPCKRFVFSNLNKSLLKLHETTTTSSDHPPQPVFTTRHQQLGCTKKPIPPSSPFHKQVWQSGQLYTLDQFQSKAKAFAKTQLSTLKQVTPLAVEDLFWKAASQTPPIYIDYANDVPGSGFGEKGVQPTTAASKLSNSPWNLQVIARSPGSLTRFMLDDIPGVTSPMIYIGMLFSWFAWHVEDHELHSLNFLHVGSPKTWYAIPGDHALPFEQVIRAKAYAGNIDHLASLTLLGEKTNLLSPDVVISSGIPCCRLVQNPGEFVVTFPRAYHIGFSHGFNCGEAANFGTPQWLKVAKAAAVRRAAMDYLPMLSHQQLLYMLTMSFISSIPKALLSGGRTSRLKDRQKEERELRVKKACIDDMLNEKHLLSVLLAKESSLYVVLWDPEALPSPDCGSHAPSSLSPMAAGIHCGGYQHGDRCNGDVHSTRMSMETLQEICEEEDDLPYGLHVDSGTLPCVACGVLGFPFMCIVQPSKDASEELFPGDCHVSQELELRPKKSNDPSGLCDAYLKSASDGHNFVQNRNISPTCRRKTVVTENSLWKVYSEAISTSLETTETRNLKESVSLPCPPNVKTSCSKIHCVDGHPLLSKGQLLHSTNNIPNKWNASNGFLRPRVFCLEHALQIVELLHSKGGANMLILCHSAYPKIKAHAFAVAEEIGVPFDFTEVPLERASKEDIDLITISMDGDGHDEGREDWTARLGLNLRYCVKLRKLSPSQDEQCALPLGVLFADTFFDLDHSNIKWKSRRTRTPYKIAGPRRSKLFSSSQTEKDVNVEKKEKICATRDNKVVQYSRRKSNHRAVLPLQAHSEDHHGPCGKHQRDDTSTSNLVLDSHLLIDTLSSIKNTGNDFLELKRSSVLNSGVQNMNCSIEHTTQVNEIVYPPRPAGEGRKNAVFKLLKSSPIDSSELQHDNCTKVKTKEKGEFADTINGTDSSELRHVNCIKVETKEKGEIADTINGTDVLTVKSRKNCSHELGLLHFVEPHRLSVAVGIREASNVSDNAIFVGSLDIPSSDLESTDPNVEKINIERCDHWVTVDTSQTHHKAVLAAAGRELSDIPDPAKLLGSQAKACSYTLIEAGTVKEDKSKACSDVVIGTSAVDMTCHAICEAKVRDFACSIAQPSFSRNKNYGTSMTLRNADRGAETSSVVQGTAPHLSMFNSQSTKRVGRKRKQVDEIAEEKSSCNGFIKSPCEGLRPRTSRLPTHATGSDVMRKKARPGNLCRGKEVKDDSRIHKCNIERCRMSFKTREQLITHKHNRCTHKGCRKQFSSHKYVLLHQRVHVDDRPLKCPWKGCKMSFKWAWARTEHLRLHTGERPYCCKTEGCKLTFRFVSDFSRHRRKSGHRAES